MARFIICVLFLLVFAGQIKASEQLHTSEYFIQLANRMQAIGSLIHDVDPAEVDSAVLLIHGWASQMDEVGDLYKRLAAELATAGIPSLRINVRGESEREATNFRLTSTFNSRVTDAQTGLDYLVESYPNASIGVVGFSLGGATAMRLVGANPRSVASLVLWSSAGNPEEIFSNLTDEQRKTALEQGEVTVPYWVDLTITRPHLLGFEGYDVFSNLGFYEGALLSIRGTEDFVPPQEETILASASANPEAVIIIEGADHIFNCLEPESAFDEMVIAETFAWLSDTMR